MRIQLKIPQLEKNPTTERGSRIG